MALGFGPLLQSFTNRFEHCLLVGELAGLEFRVEQFAVDGQFETTAAAGDQFHVLDVLFVLVQELARQTDGFRFVVSDRAVLEFYVHGNLLVPRFQFRRCRLKLSIIIIVV